MPGTCSCTHGFTRRFLLPPGGPWTSDTDSRPPAIITGTLSTSTRWAAIEMVCRPEEQKRFTVTPETLTGAPARIAATRATFEPVVPSGAAQPRITSSTSPRSSLARSAAALITCAPMSAACVSLKMPRNALPIGVRAVETITASAICFFLPKLGSDAREFLAVLHQLLEQRGGFPERVAGGVAVLHQGVVDGFQADHVVGPPHRAAAIDRPAVAVDPDDVDVERALGHLLLEDLGALVHHREQAALHDLLVGDGAAGDAELLRGLLDDLLDLGIGDRRAVGQIVLVVARAGLLAEAAELADRIGDVAGVAHVALFLVLLALADAPAHVVAGEVAHGERPHREAVVVDHLVDLLGKGAFLHHVGRLDAARAQHAVADEAFADADKDGDLSDLLRQRHDGRDDVFLGGLAAHVLEQLHDVGRREEVHADYVARPLGVLGDLVDVEAGGVRGQDRARLCHGVELLEDRFLHFHRLED